MSHAACLVYAKPDHNLKLSETSPTRRARSPSRGERCQPRSAMLNTFLVCSGFSPTSAALRPAHAPFAAATPRSIPATMLAKRRASGGGKAEVAYTVLEEDGSDVWRADDAVDVIRSGGVGVIPTDTGYDDAPRPVTRIVRPAFGRGSCTPAHRLEPGHPTSTAGTRSSRRCLRSRASVGF